MHTAIAEGTFGSSFDPDVSLLRPADDVADPEVSIVIPAMTERITISEFLSWCKEGLAKAGVAGEILIVDSSTDETPELALANGARVLRTPKCGLGRAYIDAIPFIRGKYVVIGDADCTMISATSQASYTNSATGRSISWGRGSRDISRRAQCRCCTAISERL